MYLPENFDNWNGGGPLVMNPRGYSSYTPYYARGLGGIGIGSGADVFRGTSGVSLAEAPPQQTVNLTEADLLTLFKGIPDELSQAADDLENTDVVKKAVAETRVRGILSKVKFGLRAFGVEAILDSSYERRGVSVSVSFTRAAVLDIAAGIREALNAADGRSFSGSCGISLSRSAATVLRGISGSCSIKF